MPARYCALFEHAAVCTTHTHSCVAKTKKLFAINFEQDARREGISRSKWFFSMHAHADFIWSEYYIGSISLLRNLFARFSNCLYQRATNARREGKHRYLDVPWKTNDIFVAIREPIRIRPEFDGRIRAHFVFLAKCNSRFPTRRSREKLSISGHWSPGRGASFFEMAFKWSETVSG